MARCRIAANGARPALAHGQCVVLTENFLQQSGLPAAVRPPLFCRYLVSRYPGLTERPAYSLR